MNNYLQTLSRAETQRVGHQDIFNRLDKTLQSMKVFDKTLFLKSKQLDLVNIYFNKKSIRLLKAFGTFLGLSLSLLVLSSMAQSLSIVIIFFGSLMSAGMGWCIPEFYMQDRVKTHQFLLNQAVPIFLEQFHMLTSSSGYESFPQALKLIAPSFPGTLGDELRRLMTVQPYLNELELLNRLTLICSHSLLKELSVSIRVSTQYGTSLTHKTARLVEMAQQLREQQTKDIANKTSGILLGPLLLFHLPALLIIFLIPFIFILQKGI